MAGSMTATQADMSIISRGFVEIILQLALVQQMRAESSYFGEVFLAQKMCCRVCSRGENHYLAMRATQLNPLGCSLLFIITGDVEAAHTDGVIDGNFVVCHRSQPRKKLTLQ